MDKIEVEIVPKVSKSSLGSLSKTFGEAMGGAKQMASGMKPYAGAAMEGAGSLISGAGTGAMMAGGAAIAGVGAAIAGFMAFSKAIESFVEVANPAVVEGFSAAVKDVVAVIGHTLTPVFTVLTPMVEMFGDFLASIIPTGGQMQAIMNRLGPALNDLKDFLATAAPDLQELGIVGVKLALVVIPILVKAFQKLLESIRKLMAFLNYSDGRDARGKRWEQGVGGKFDRSSRGAAAGGSSAVGIADLGQNFRVAAFGAGIAPAERTASATEKSAESLKNIENELGKKNQGSTIGGDF